MKPLRIEFNLNSGMVVQDDHPKHLDGLLTYAKTVELESMGHFRPWQEALDISDVLASCQEDVERPVWCASMLNFKYAGNPEWFTMIRKSDATTYLEAKEQGVLRMGGNKLDTNSGENRGFFFYVRKRFVDQATAWCIGDKSRLEALLPHIKSIGKMGKNGHGAVTNFEIHEDEKAFEMWRYRVLPETVKGAPGHSYALTMEAASPPYWQVDRREVSKYPV
jgi:CRISPR type IV-associated protein Csf3